MCKDGGKVGDDTGVIVTGIAVLGLRGTFPMGFEIIHGTIAGTEEIEIVAAE